MSENLDFVLKATGWKIKKKREERIEEVLNELNIHFSLSSYNYWVIDRNGENFELIEKF